MSSLIEDVFLILNILVELVELDRLLNSEKLLVDGLKNLSELFSALLIILSPTPMLKILKISPSITSLLIELPKVEEELTEPMVESVLTFHLKPTSKCGLLKEPLTLKEKEKPDKSPREKSQSENLNDFCHLFKLFFFIDFSD
jgi:hypothetical protein